MELRRLIREMSLDNALWGAPRIHGELLKLGFVVGQTTVAKYMAKRRRPPSQSWKTFLRNHAEGIAALDLFVAPTADLRMLFALVIVRIDRRLIVTTNVTARPTAEWIARQVIEAFPWDQAPRYLIRDRDGVRMGTPTSGVSKRWESETDQRHPDRRGRTVTPRD